MILYTYDQKDNILIAKDLNNTIKPSGSISFSDIQKALEVRYE